MRRGGFSSGQALLGRVVGVLKCAGLGHTPHVGHGQADFGPHDMILGAPVMVVGMGMQASMPVWQCSARNGWLASPAGKSRDSCSIECPFLEGICWFRSEFGRHSTLMTRPIRPFPSR